MLKIKTAGMFWPTGDFQSEISNRCLHEASPGDFYWVLEAPSLMMILFFVLSVGSLPSSFLLAAVSTWLYLVISAAYTCAFISDCCMFKMPTDLKLEVQLVQLILQTEQTPGFMLCRSWFLYRQGILP